jgi:hypothetical protein
MFNEVITTRDEEVHKMAKTADEKKIVPVRPYKKAKPGGAYRKVQVSGHRRSTPRRSS